MQGKVLLLVLLCGVAPTRGRLAVEPDAVQVWAQTLVGFTVSVDDAESDAVQLCVQVASAPLPALFPHWQCGLRPNASRVGFEAPSFAGDGTYYARFLVDRSGAEVYTGQAATLPPFVWTAGDLVEVALDVRAFSQAAMAQRAGEFTTVEASPGRQLFENVERLLSDAAWVSAVNAKVDTVGDVFVAMVTGALVEELLNSVYVMRTHAKLRNLLVACLDDACAEALEPRTSVAFFRAGDLCPACARASEYAPYASNQFGHITAVKMVLVAAVVRMGYRAWWLDADVLLFKDPRLHPKLAGDPTTTVVEAVGGPGSSTPNATWSTARRDYHVDVGITFDDYIELVGKVPHYCSGFFFVAPSPFGVAFINHVIHVLGLASSPSQRDVKFFDDQAAFNVAVNHPPPSLRGGNVVLMPPRDFPNGGNYLTQRHLLSESLFALHNNHIAHPDKAGRLRGYGMWFVEAEDWGDVLSSS